MNLLLVASIEILYVKNCTGYEVTNKVKACNTVDMTIFIISDSRWISYSQAGSALFSRQKK